MQRSQIFAFTIAFIAVVMSRLNVATCTDRNLNGTIKVESVVEVVLVVRMSDQ